MEDGSKSGAVAMEAASMKVDAAAAAGRRESLCIYGGGGGQIGRAHV